MRCKSVVIVTVLAVLSACEGDGYAASVNAPGGVSVQVRLASTVTGEPQTVAVDLLGDRAATTGAVVTLRWSMNEMPMGGRAARLMQTPHGLYEERGFSFAMAGTWRAHVSVRESSNRTIRADFSIPVRD